MNNKEKDRHHNTLSFSACFTPFFFRDVGGNLVAGALVGVYRVPWFHMGNGCCENKLVRVVLNARGVLDGFNIADSEGAHTDVEEVEGGFRGATGRDTSACGDVTQIGVGEDPVEL